MCIIVYKPAGEVLDKNILDNCQAHNPDGQGYAYALEGKIHIYKEVKDYQKLYNHYKKNIIDKKLEKKLAVLWHFRIKTHGEINEANCHPFKIGDGNNMAFCHNGTLHNIKADKDKEKSDTVLFRDKILNHLPKNWIHNPGLVTLMANFVSTNNKLAFLLKDGQVRIVNMTAGEMNEGIWYSNVSYKRRKEIKSLNENASLWNRNHNKLLRGSEDEETRYSPHIKENSDKKLQTALEIVDVVPKSVLGYNVFQEGRDRGKVFDIKQATHVWAPFHSDLKVRRECMKYASIRSLYYKAIQEDRASVMGEDNKDSGDPSLYELASMYKKQKDNKVDTQRSRSTTYCECGMELATFREITEGDCDYCAEKLRRNNRGRQQLH
jgi:glutamine amidotransferase